MGLIDPVGDRFLEGFGQPVDGQAGLEHTQAPAAQAQEIRQKQATGLPDWRPRRDQGQTGRGRGAGGRPGKPLPAGRRSRSFETLGDHSGHALSRSALSRAAGVAVLHPPPPAAALQPLPPPRWSSWDGVERLTARLS